MNSVLLDLPLGLGLVADVVVPPPPPNAPVDHFDGSSLGFWVMAAVAAAALWWLRRRRFATNDAAKASPE